MRPPANQSACEYASSYCSSPTVLRPKDHHSGASYGHPQTNNIKELAAHGNTVSSWLLLQVLTALCGRSAAAVAKFRPSMPVICFMTDARLAREMQLTRGVHSVLLTDEEMVRWYVRPRSVFHSGCVHTHVYIVCVHAPCAPARGTSAGRL